VLSGRRDDRPEYQRMVEFVKAGGADVIIVQYLDRFGRNSQEILTRIWQLRDFNVIVQVTDEDIQEELMLLMRAGFAGAESRRTSERVKANMARIVSKGTHSGRVPFGFTPIKKIEDGKAVVERWEIDEAKAEVVREMVRLATEENLGFLAIANALNDKGYRTTAGGHWVAASVQVILRNPVLNGTMVYGRRGKKKANVADQQDLVRVEGVFPKILSDEEWAALQQRLDIRREHSRGATHKSEYLLSGILRCGYCGGPMIGKMTSTYKGKGYPRYYCSSAQKSRQSCAYYNGHSAPKLEAAIEADFAKNLDLLKRDLLNEEEFKQANEARPEEQAQLQARLEELASSLTAQSQRHDAVDALPVQIRSFLKDVQSLDVLRAKALLQPIMRTASVDRECTIELAFK
jgi:DNA invertase Pin-like site-specific DNA recombinase